MSIDIFRKEYTIRRFGPQKLVNGYATRTFQDITAKLNVQPLTPDELQALPEGERQFKRIKSFGSTQLTAANQLTGVAGDWLYYQGQWYKCVSAAPWDHTLLEHYEAQFAAIPETDISITNNLQPPEVVKG